MDVSFVKMHGIGNDFVVLDGRRKALAPSETLLRAIADRRRGIGCDQIVLIEEPQRAADAGVRFWNSDGGESGACGNGSRCVAALLMDELKKDAVTLETRGGLLWCSADGPDRVVVDMGKPRLNWEEIPLAERMDTRRLDIKLGPIDAPVLHSPSAVNMGNPHCVFFVDDTENFDLARIGPMIEYHPLFPERANISLAAVKSPSEIRLRVWERGAGLTQACGTAACATLVAAVRRGLSSRKAEIVLPGGSLSVEWREGDDHVLMAGPVATSFKGTFSLETLGRAS